MAEFDVTTGFDTWVTQAAPGQNNSAGRYPSLRGAPNAFRTYVSMPLTMSRIAGKTILEATLSAPAQSNWISQTLSVEACDSSWNVSRITWGNQPGVIGSAVTAATGVRATGQRFTIDVKDLIQAIANGQPNYGWRVTTSQNTDRSTLRGFNSGFPSWVLHVEVSDLLVKPTHLAPTGVIGVSKPTLVVDDLESLSAIQVQIDSAANPSSVDFDSGWVAVTKPQLSLASSFPRSVASVVTTSGSATITFPANQIETADIGAAITRSGIPGGATIIARPTTTTATLSANATASSTATATVTRSYAGLANDATTYWRARLKTANGSMSTWSDWLDITREDKPAIVMDNPSGTALWDSTPTISAHLDPVGDADTRWQVIVQDADDPTDVRYNSGDHLDGAALEHQVPLRWKGRKVFPVDGDYKLIVKAWDRTDRVPSPGDLPYIRLPLTVTLDADAAVTAPSSITVSQATSGYPNVIVGWTRGSDPDQFAIWRDGKILAKVDPDDVRVSPGVFEWADETAAPNVEHSYKVRAVTDLGDGVPRQGIFSATATIFAKVVGTWLRWGTHDVVLDGSSPDDPGINAEQVTKRQTFELPYLGRDIDLVTSVGGLVGTFDGSIDRRQDDLEATVALLSDLRQTPRRDVRLVWFTQNIPIDLKSLSVVPSKAALVPDMPMYDVKFEFAEIDESDD